MSRAMPLVLGLALLACSPATAQDGETPAANDPSPAAGPESVPAPGPAPAPGDPAIPADTEVVTTASGLRYSVLRAGDTAGPTPKTGDPVKVSYTGWLPSGKVFDASDRHGGPASFAVGQLVPGWNEALKLMHRGDRLKLTIPPALGYGDAGAPPDIPPGATLIFVLELHDFWTFSKLDDTKAKTTDSGLRYEVLKQGTGAAPTADEAVELRFALWNASGKLLTSTDQQGQPLQGRPADLPLPVLKEGAALLPGPGARVLLEAPPALAFGDKNQGPDLPPNSTTLWEVELVRTARALPVPDFAMPEESKLKKTASGLQYEMVRDGSGTPPTRADKVTVHYAGWLTDGTLFDSSYPRAFPTTFPLGGVIPGWQEGLAMMKPGSVWTFVIPPGLAYGARAAGKIPPNSTLVFRVELLKVGE